ncbi:MAG TPA: hypothetical protein VG389_15565 [Myxococcota bacterium]|jgi:hypothetical protein|nr:hypothetical protein [Myxococcota bacterium]
MGMFWRAVIIGFGFSLGAAIFKRVAPHLGLEDQKDDPAKPAEAPPAEPKPAATGQPQPVVIDA